MRVDMRSDTVTLPSPAMREAMYAAALGDDVMGDDPSVNALQEKIADMLGFDGALFMPTGTQSNFCALLAHCERGDEYLVGQMAHCYRSEAGGGAVLGGIQPQPIAHQPDGTLALTDIEACIKPDDIHYARTRLLALENTLGGKVMPHEYIESATSLARSRGLATHLDGARLFNAAVVQASRQCTTPQAEARKMAQCFDSVSICFSKSLGAPIGSALCGTRDFLQRALRIRKMAGGGMRQSGMLAAAASYALDHHVDRLARDHELMQVFANGIDGLPGIRFEWPQSNIVFVELEGKLRERSAEFMAYLRQHGVLVNGTYRLRFVTHLDLDRQGVEYAAGIIRRFVQEA